MERMRNDDNRGAQKNVIQKYVIYTHTQTDILYVNEYEFWEIVW